MKKKVPTVTISFTLEELDRLIDLLNMIRNDPDAEHLCNVVETQLRPN